MSLTTRLKCERCDGCGEVEVANGKAVRRARKEAGMSLRYAARVIGISPTFLCDVEHGRRTMSLQTLKRLKRRLS